VRKIELLIVLLLIGITVFAQPRNITVTSERNTDRTISLYADNSSAVDYTIKLMLTLKGYTADMNNTAMVRVSTGRNKIATLKPALGSANDFTASYRYSYLPYPGLSFRKKPDTDIPYLIPTTEGNSLRISQLTDLSQTLGRESSGVMGMGFVYKLGDTICAARAGRIYEFLDDVTEGETSTQTFSRHRNRISIEHKDGTLSNYSLLAPIRSLASVGDDVIPGQPLAVFNKESDKMTLLFTVYYIDEKKALINKDNENESAVSPYEFVTTNFYTGSNGTEPLLLNRLYTAIHNKDIIAKELSKKEKKKLGIQ
jgi:hypothetical protein